MDKLLNLTAQLTQQDFGLVEIPTHFTEDEFIQLLSVHIAAMLEHDLERLFAILYRLDVRESYVHAALLPQAPVPPHVGIALLIVEREKQKAHTRLLYSDDSEGDGFWA